MESQLKGILQKNNCIFDRFMSKIQYIKSKDDIHEEIFLTPVFTSKGKKILFISREIQGNWFESKKDIEDILYFLEKQHNYSLKDHEFIFHIFIVSIKFEHFYRIDLSSDKKLIKLNPDKFPELLK